MKTRAAEKRITAEKFSRLRWDPALRERKTTTDYLASALRTAIYDGQFADGEELNQVELANHFNVSRVPIREALRQLQAEGLVRIVAHRKAVVAGLTLDEILELIEMRAVLEGYLVRKWAPDIDGATLRRLRNLCDEMDLITDYGADWVIRNSEFHRMLYRADDSATMLETVERIHLKVERYTRKAGTQKRLRAAAAEHRRILDAIESRDFTGAAVRMEQHILNTGEDIKRHQQKKR